MVTRYEVPATPPRVTGVPGAVDWTSKVVSTGPPSTCRLLRLLYVIVELNWLLEVEPAVQPDLTPSPVGVK